MSVLNQMIRFSEGRGNLGKVKNRTLPIERFAKRFETPTRSRETIAAYQKLKLSDKQVLKAADGFIFAAPSSDGRRKKESVLDRDMISIDIDENGEEVLQSIRDGSNWVCQHAFLLHTTRSHTVEHPKFRIFVFSAKQIEPEDHAKVSRIVASKIDPTMLSIDPVSHRLAQMMYKPSCSKDSEYIYIFNHEDVECFDPEELLQEFRDTVGDPDDFSLLPINPDKESDVRGTLEKAEDPTAKEGPVGIWCRAYSIEDVIAEHLTDFYVPAEHSGTDTRYTAVGAQGNAGCVIYDDGKFMFSNHTSDPCAEQLVNAWDILRLCKFGDLDEEARDNSSLANLPSSKAMLKFAQNDGRYKDQLMDERYNPEDMFDEDDVEGGDFDSEELDEIDIDEDLSAAIQADIDELIGDVPGEERELPESVLMAREKQVAPADKEWRRKLEADKQGNLLPSLPNVTRILLHDRRFRRLLGHNELEQETYLVRDLVDKKNPTVPSIKQSRQQKRRGGIKMEDSHDAVIRAIIAERNGEGFSGYGIDPAERTLRDAIVNVSAMNKFHPALDRFDQIEWDGIPRLGTFLHDYLGTPDNAYYAESFTEMMVALVARQYEPGHKFDQMMILEGAQGARKSTLVKVLAMRDFFLELTCDLDDSQKIAEQTRGAMICEIPELQNFRRAESEAAKAFLSRDREKVRMAYARKSVEVHRQFVVFGTTNVFEYLIDATGNRRYWPVRVNVDLIDIDAVEAIVTQLYAEAREIFIERRIAQPDGDLHLDLKSKNAIAIHRELTDSATEEKPEHELAGRIEEWMNTPVAVSSIIGAEESLDHPDADKMAIRTMTCAQEVAQELLGGRADAKNSYFVNRALDLVPDLVKDDTRRHFPGYGRQRGYYRRKAVGQYELLDDVVEDDPDDLI